MKPPPFDYYAPHSIEEAVGLLQEHAEHAKVLAGGQSLMPLLNMRLARPEVVVDVNRLAELAYVRAENGSVAIGALTRHHEVETAPLLLERCPVLARAAREVGDVQVRNRGTFGGSIAHADPAAQFCAVVYTLSGEIVAAGPAGTRSIPAEEFFLGPLTTALAPDELVIEVRVPAVAGPGWSFRSLVPRHGDFAVAGVLTVLDADADGTCTGARVGMFGVGPTPLRARSAEAALVGSRLEDSIIAEAALLASQEAEPSSDLSASADYRREVLKYLFESVVQDARSRLGAGR